MVLDQRRQLGLRRSASEVADELLCHTVLSEFARQ
jgi:hypothetical protein